LKAKTILFFLILSALIPQAYAADFGEDHAYLGQVVDDYENDDNVDAAVDVIHNSTLECMELNYSGIGVKWDDIDFYEDFEDFTTDWTTVSGNLGVIEKSNVHVYNGSWSGRIYAPNPTSYCYGYIGMNEQIGDFITIFYLYVDDSVEPDYEHVVGIYDVSGGGYVWELRLDYHDSNYWLQNDIANSGTDIKEINSLEWISIIVIFDDSEDELNYYVNEEDCGIFTANNGNLDGDRIYIGDTWGAGWRGYYYLDDLIIGEGEIIDGYSDGYYITKELLSGDRVLNLMYNVSIPEGTGGTMEFSTDGNNWVNHNNVSGYETLVNGFESIDLRDLNTSICYVRVNMTSNNPLLTLRLYQLRYVTIIETIEDNTGALLIVGFIMGMIIFIGVSRN